MWKQFVTAAVCALAGSIPAQADPYTSIAGGCFISSDTSNQDALEFNGDIADCGGLIAAEGGYSFDLDFASLDLGLEAALRAIDLHGQNGHRKATADGQTLHATSVMGNLRLRREVIDNLSVYGMGGIGATRVFGLHDVSYTPAWQAEAGLRVDIWDGISAHAGYRYFQALNVNLDGNQSSPDFHGPVAGFRLEFTNHLDQLDFLSVGLN